MNEIILYSTGCPKCNVLKKKLDAAHIPYTINSNTEDMKNLGISAVPVLSVDGNLMSFTDAVKYTNSRME